MCFDHRVNVSGFPPFVHLRDRHHRHLNRPSAVSSRSVSLPPLRRREGRWCRGGWWMNEWKDSIKMGWLLSSMRGVPPSSTVPLFLKREGGPPVFTFIFISSFPKGVYDSFIIVLLTVKWPRGFSLMKARVRTKNYYFFDYDNTFLKNEFHIL